MLEAKEIELRLGASTVASIESAISRGFAAAQQSSDPHQAIEAMRYLLLQMLAATVMTPVDGARERARDIGLDLVELVDAALANRGSAAH